MTDSAIQTMFLNSYTFSNSRRLKFDITDENEAFDKCDGNVSKDSLGRLVVFETKCKKFSSSRCRLARKFARRQDCLEREICYQKPRLLTKSAIRNMKCASGNPAKIRLRKIVRRPNQNQQSNCQNRCPLINSCETTLVKKCQTNQVRICDRLPEEECDKPVIQKRIVLKCTEIAEIPHDLVQSLNGGNSTNVY